MLRGGAISNPDCQPVIVACQAQTSVGCLPVVTDYGRLLFPFQEINLNPYTNNLTSILRQYVRF